MERVDLHMHTKYSDGDYTLIEILKMCEREKLKYIAITDHDVIDSYYELDKLDVMKYYAGKIINGVELKCVHNGVAIEVLGYNYNINELSKSKWVDRNTKHEIQKLQLENLKKAAKRVGLKVDDNLSLENSNFANNVLYTEISKYDDNKEILNKLGIKNSKTMYRNCVCNPNSEFYVDESNYQLNIVDVAKLIHDCGGIAILAHPFGTYFVENSKRFIDSILDLNVLDGLECMHPCINKEESEYLIDICEKRNLLMTGGSDFHRVSRSKLSYVNFEKEQIPIELIQKFLKKIEK